MASQWEYRQIFVRWDKVPRSSWRRDYEEDFIAELSEGTWLGWHNILDNLGRQGWEVFNIIDCQRNPTNGFVMGYAVFAKRPR
jgi:hypothetical protein